LGQRYTIQTLKSLYTYRGTRVVPRTI